MSTIYSLDQLNKIIIPSSISSSNAIHTIRNASNWIYNEDGAVTGALQIKLIGMYSQSLSGGMNITVTQNSGADGVFPDYSFYIAGNWRATDHLWHNTKARCLTTGSTMNIRYCNDGTDVFIVIGDISTVWNYPRMIISDIISNAIISGFTVDFAISRITSYPSIINTTTTTTNQSNFSGKLYFIGGM